MLARCAAGAARWLPLLVLPLAAACGGPESSSEGPTSPGGAVSTATPEATAAAVRVLAMGGNAVDAAVAAAFVLGVTEPSESGLGGHAVMLVVSPEGEGVVVHAPGGEPLASSRGGYALAHPTALAVLGHAFERYGSGELTWKALVTPAAELATEGWPVGRYRHRVTVQQYTRLLTDSVTIALLLRPDRSIPTEGAVATNPDLAATLRTVADRGAGALASGALPGSLASALEARGYAGASGWLGSAPGVTETPPLQASYRGFTVLTAPEPYGGPTLVRALGFLQDAPPRSVGGGGIVRTAWIAEALGWARSRAADPGAYMAGLPPLPVPPPDTLNSGERMPPAPAERRPSPGPPPAGAAPGGEQTTHVSVIDGRGLAVSLTLSLGETYGAGFVAGDLGFFAARFPGVGASPADTTGRAAPAQAASPTAGWWAVPTVLVRDGRPEFAVGSPGGPRGVSAVVQVVAGWVDGGALADVVAAPRVHVDPDSTRRQRWVLEGVVWIDSARSSARVLAPFGDSLVRRVAAERGVGFGEHDAGPFFQDWDPWFGGVQAVARVEGDFIASSDPRRDGEARTVTAEDVVEATGKAFVGDADDVGPAAPEAPPPPDSGG